MLKILKKQETGPSKEEENKSAEQHDKGSSCQKYLSAYHPDDQLQERPEDEQ
jgi:hypothetical protein